MVDPDKLVEIYNSKSNRTVVNNLHALKLLDVYDYGYEQGRKRGLEEARRNRATEEED